MKIDDYRLRPGKKARIDRFDPGDTTLVSGGRKEGERLSQRLAGRLDNLQERLYAEHKHKLLIVLQGMDTSGKDGTIRHVAGAFNPQGVRIKSFKKPTVDELDHDYLWRAHLAVPAAGEIVVFNRSHYEDVLVVRVHELVPPPVWRRRFRQINDFERMLAETGTTILKFFLHIDRAEQRQRLEKRIRDSDKRWKYQHGDVEESKLWSDYMAAYEDALTKTSTKWAPWYVVPANAKWYRNFLVSSVVAATLGGLKMRFPEPDLSAEVLA
jgi:PPK2 family polyphosphate:nucleotide phosphotransferase